MFKPESEVLLISQLKISTMNSVPVWQGQGLWGRLDLLKIIKNLQLLYVGVVLSVNVQEDHST